MRGTYRADVVGNMSVECQRCCFSNRCGIKIRSSISTVTRSRSFRGERGQQSPTGSLKCSVAGVIGRR